MKTSELKRVLWEDYVETWGENDEVLHGTFWTVWKKEQRLIVNGVVPLGVLKVLGEYQNTPPLKREDEKRYRIIVHSAIFKHTDYLALIVDEKTYYFSMFETDSEEHQKTFTQWEIDNFPAEIKGAIASGFLKKEEVE